MTHEGFRAAPHGWGTALSLFIVVGLLASACASSTQQDSNPIPTSSSALPQSPVASPSAVVPLSPAPSPSLQAVRLTVAGTEFNASLQLTEELPAGWTHESFGGYRGSSEPGPPAGIGHFVSLIDNTFNDPCLHVPRNPKVGPTAADAAAALGAIPDITATRPVPATIAGFDATYIELAIPASLPCAPKEFYLWQDSPDGHFWVQGLNETVRVWILEVRGQRVAIATRSWPGTSAEAKAELQGILDSIVFDPGP